MEPLIPHLEEIKKQARKEFDNLFVWRQGVVFSLDIQEDVKSFLDSLIDKTVQMSEERIVGCKIDSHIPTEDGEFCECGYFGKKNMSEERMKHIRDTVSNFANFKKDVLTLVQEDVPIYAQKRLLEILDLKVNSNWNYKPLITNKSDSNK